MLVTRNVSPSVVAVSITSARRHAQESKEEDFFAFRSSTPSFASSSFESPRPQRRLLFLAQILDLLERDYHDVYPDEQTPFDGNLEQLVRNLLIPK